ncbi:MAG: response regulator transcription factor [Alphaproteobacteria bacterium]
MSANTVVALIDDDRALATAMGRYLTEFGFEVRMGVSCADANEMAQAGGVDLFILDRRLPDGDGLAMAEEIKSVSNAAVIILSGLGEVDHRVEGLNTGADDYLPKPAAPEELLARVQAVVRRSRSVSQKRAETTQVFQSFILDRTNSCIVGVTEAKRRLTGIESLILEMLINANGEIVDKDALSRNALGRAWQPDDRSLDVHISRLRQKIRDVGVAETVIQTVRGHGYRFSAS